MFNLLHSFEAYYQAHGFKDLRISDKMFHNDSLSSGTLTIDFQIYFIQIYFILNLSKLVNLILNIS